MSADLGDLWSDLERSAQVPGITVRRFLPDAPVDVLVGIENPGQTRLFFVEASKAAFAARGSKWPQSAGFTVALEASSEAEHRYRLVVRLTVANYQDVFSTLVSDLLAIVQRSKNESSAVRSFVARIERWQRLLARHGADVMTPLEQRGLYGELLFLRDYVLPACAPDAAIEAWTGPLAKDQDFQLRTCSVEVKVTVANTDSVIHVSNVRQLDDSGAGRGGLYLLHFSLEERHQQGESLVAIVDQLRAEMGLHVDSFNDRLFQAGYIDAQAASYMDTGYVQKGHGFYVIKDNFPRIRERELRPGVGNVKYTVAVGACTPFMVTDATAVEAIRGKK